MSNELKKKYLNMLSCVEEVMVKEKAKSMLVKIRRAWEEEDRIFESMVTQWKSEVEKIKEYASEKNYDKLGELLSTGLTGTSWFVFVRELSDENRVVFLEHVYYVLNLKQAPMRGPFSNLSPFGEETEEELDFEKTFKSFQESPMFNNLLQQASALLQKSGNGRGGGNAQGINPDQIKQMISALQQKS